MMGAMCSLKVTVCAWLAAAAESRKIVFRWRSQCGEPVSRCFRLERKRCREFTLLVAVRRRGGGGAVRVRRDTSLPRVSRAGGREPPSRYRRGGRFRHGRGWAEKQEGVGRFRDARG